MDGQRQCSKCEQWKAVEEFSKNKSRASGLEPRCKQCVSEYHRRYNVENRAERTEAARRWRERNPDYQRQNVARWRERNYADHLLKSRIYASARRARIRDQFVEDIDPIVVFERDAGICGICGLGIVGRFDVDHIIPLVRGGEHSYANVQAAHPSCNSSKKDKVYAQEGCQQTQAD